MNKIPIPEKEELSQRLLATRSTKTMSKIYKVSRTTIFSWLKHYQIKLLNLHDVIGKKYGLLTVLEQEYNKDNQKTYLKCVCECGNYFLSSKQSILRGDTKSCGCYKHNICWKGCGEISGHYWNRLKKGAERRKLKWEISIEFAWKIFKAQDSKCAISGEPISFVRRYDKDCQNQTASLDRIDNSKGYIEGNVQWVHKQVNLMKHTLSENELINWCIIIVKNNKKADFMEIA